MILTKSKVKSIDLDFEVSSKIKNGKINELLLIVPTNRKIRYLKKEIISQAPGGTTPKLNLETIGTFAQNLLFVDKNAGHKVLTEAASTVLLKQSFLKAALKYFSNYKKDIPSGTLIRIKNVISEYKKQGITPDVLRKEAEHLEGTEKYKAEDITNIFEIYRQLCSSLDVKEIGDVYNLLNQISDSDFKTRFEELYPDVNFVVINGFDEFTSPEIDIINSASLIENIDLYLAFDYYDYNPLIFSHLDKCYNKLRMKKFEPVVDKSIATLNKFNTAVRENLFLKKKINSISGYKEKITRINARTRTNEVELIAKEIKDLILEKQVEPHKICVVFNLIKKYSPAVRDLFSVYGIPFNLTDRFNLSDSLPVVSIINFLEIIENDFYYKNIFRALSGGYIQLGNINLSNLLKASVNLKILSGLMNWKNSLNDAIKRIEEGTIDEDEQMPRPDDIEVYKKALLDVETLYDYLAPFDKKMTLKEFAINLEALIYSLNVPQRLIADGSSLVEENVKALTTFIDTVTELMELFELEYGKTEKYPLRFYLNHIRTAVSSSRYNVKEKPGYGVQVTTLNEIRGLQFDYLFIAGMCDGDLPTRYTPEIFFSGSFFRKEISHQTEERYQFYQSLCSWKEGLYLSAPQAEEKQELVQSNFLTEFTSLFETKVKNEDDYSRVIYSEEELQIDAGFAGIDEFEKLYEGVSIPFNLDKVDKAITINNLRLSDPFGNSAYTGFISEELSGEYKLKLEAYKSKQYSISQLETYAKCPYKYFAERVLKLQPQEEPTEEIEALEMGTLLHSILYKFYETLKEKRIVLKNCSNHVFKVAEDLIFNIAEEKINSAGFSSPLTFYEREKITGINGDRANSILYKFISFERNDGENFIPSFFEIGFGDIKGSAASEPGVVENFTVRGVNVRGKIDRIDISSSKETYKVVDYKLSGKKPDISDLEKGISLQLPLYMYAAKELIKTELGIKSNPAGSEIYSLKFKDTDFGKQRVKPYRGRKELSEAETIQENQNLINTCLDAIENYAELISNGEFHLSRLKDRENKVCRYCQFKPVCRIQDVK